MRSSFVSSLVVAVGLLSATSVFAAESKDYGASGRVSALEGTLYGKGPYDTETSELAQNAVLRAGDEIVSDEGTFAEVELPNGTFLRLAGNTTVLVNKLDTDGVEIALTQGAAYLSRGINAPPARFQTFAGTVELGGRSEVRVANDAQKSALEVSVADGSAELRGDRNAQQIRQGETLSTAGNKINGFDASRGDAFDRWNGERESKVRNYNQDTHVAANTVGSYELEGNGTWVQVDGYSAWRPTTVAAGWRPYSDGYWSWEEPWGWVWVDYQPWGYTTSHYGRWYFRNAYGWVWYPDPVWAPAWVVWAAFDSSIGWAPCDFWGRPIYCHSYYSYYDYDAWCYSDSEYFYGGGGYHYGHPGVSASARHEGTGRLASSTHTAAGRSAIGRDGKFAIRKFDAETMKRATPVPVRDPVRELTPSHIVKAAADGRIKGVTADNRRGELLNRAAKQGGVKPEPWNRGTTGLGGSRDLNEKTRNENPRGATGIGGGADRLKTQGWSGRGNEDGRAAEGWSGRGGTATQPADRGTTGIGDRGRGTTTNDDNAVRYPGIDRGNTARQPASHFQPADDGRGNTRGSTGEIDSNRGGNNDTIRGSSENNTGHWAPERSGGGNNAQQPARSEPSRSEPARSEPSRSEPSRPATSAPSRSAPSAPAHSSPSSGHKGRSSWSAPSTGRSVAFGGGSSHSSGFSFGHSSGGHSSFGGGHSSGVKLKFGKR